MTSADLGSVSFDDDDEDLALPADVQAAVDTAPGLRSLEQWRSIALHLEGELIRHSAEMAEIANENRRRAEEAIGRAQAAEKKAEAYRAVLSTVEGMIGRRGLHSIDRRTWASRVTDAKTELVRLASTPAGREALMRLHRASDPVFVRSKASMPTAHGALAERLYRDERSRRLTKLNVLAPVAKRRGRPEKPRTYAHKVLAHLEIDDRGASGAQPLRDRVAAYVRVSLGVNDSVSAGLPLFKQRQLDSVTEKVYRQVLDLRRKRARSA